MLDPIRRIDPRGLQTPALCANPANTAACVAAGEISQAAGAKRLRNEIAKLLGAMTVLCAALDKNCAEVADLLNKNFDMITQLEELGFDSEDLKREHDEDVDDFCRVCPDHCPYVKKFRERIIN